MSRRCLFSWPESSPSDSTQRRLESLRRPRGSPSIEYYQVEPNNRFIAPREDGAHRTRQKTDQRSNTVYQHGVSETAFILSSVPSFQLPRPFDKSKSPTFQLQHHGG